MPAALDENKIFVEEIQSNDKPYCFFTKRRLKIELGSPTVNDVTIKPINPN